MGQNEVVIKGISKFREFEYLILKYTSKGKRLCILLKKAKKDINSLGGSIPIINFINEISNHLYFPCLSSLCFLLKDQNVKARNFRLQSQLQKL